MSSMERRLAENEGSVLHKQAVAGIVVELVDIGLVPTVRVSKAGKSSQFDLEKIGLMWSDADSKFYHEDSGEEVRPNDFADLAIERYFFNPEGR